MSGEQSRGIRRNSSADVPCLCLWGPGELLTPLIITPCLCQTKIKQILSSETGSVECLIGCSSCCVRLSLHTTTSRGWERGGFSFVDVDPVRARVCLCVYFHVGVCGYLKWPPSIAGRHHSPAPDTSRWGDGAAASASLRLPLSG